MKPQHFQHDERGREQRQHGKARPKQNGQRQSNTHHKSGGEPLPFRHGPTILNEQGGNDLGAESQQNEALRWRKADIGNQQDRHRCQR